MDEAPESRYARNACFHQRVRTGLAFARFVIWLVVWTQVDDWQ